MNEFDIIMYELHKINKDLKKVRPYVSENHKTAYESLDDAIQRTSNILSHFDCVEVVDEE